MKPSPLSRKSWLNRKSRLKNRGGDKFKNRRRDPEKLAWLRQQPCAVSGQHTCRLPVEAHHLHQERHDDETVPACQKAHHDELGQWGKEVFAAHYGLDMDSIAAGYAEMWRVAA